jgi:pyrrolidone-carboxylate peptidase
MNRETRILLYGFGPYRHFKDNITAKVIKTLPALSGLKRVVFPVRFHRGQFVQALERHKTDVVLGLGQSSRRSIEFETQAVNRRRGGKKAKARAIRRRGPRWLPTTLEIPYGRIKRSKNAGDYVCNFSMYVMLEQIRRAGAKIKFGFVHIPHDADPRQATQVIARALRKIRAPKRRRRRQSA